MMNGILIIGVYAYEKKNNVIGYFTYEMIFILKTKFKIL